VGRSVNLDRQFCGRAVEIEHIIADRMLAAEVQFAAADSNPKKFFGQ
jgi:hypothetical protein